MPAVSVYTIYM